MRTIISGMFRSGTTHLWRILSADPAFEVSYCEPLHPRLDQEMLTLEHYKSYQERSDLIRKYWTPDFSSKRILLDHGDSYPELAMYLQHLLVSQSLAKFVRMTLRIGWFAHLFRDTFIINILRDPRAVCFSILHHPASDEIVRRDLPWEDWHAREYFELYSHAPPFRDYLLSLQDEPPYIKVLALWRINVERSLFDLENHVENGMVLRYEDLCLLPEERLRMVYQKMGRRLPIEVSNAVHRPHGTERKWQQATTCAWMDQYKQVKSVIWHKAIRRAKIGSVMEQLGYQP